ncbi:MAG: ankyrin repeat domain-containing protein [Micavibrio sp.]|nr:MAG: ankyrin repeat domain-containing protein [Micavibrio sp.]
MTENTETFEVRELTLEERFWRDLTEKDDFDCDYYLRRGIDPDLRDSNGYPAAVVALKNEKHENVKKLLLAGADPHATGADQYTLLMRAAGKGQAGFCAWLLDNTEIDINAQDKDGDTALSEAVYHQCPKTAQLLFARGADPYILNYKGENLLDWAQGSKSQQIVGLVQKMAYPVHKGFTKTGHDSVTCSEKTPDGAVLSKTFNFSARVVSSVISSDNGIHHATETRFRDAPQHLVSKAGEALRILNRQSPQRRH